MKNLITCLFLALTVSVFAQKRDIDVQDFSKLSFGVPGTLYLTQGSETSLTIEASDNVMESIDVVQEGSRLRIKQRNYKSWKNWKGQNITVWVTMRDISALSVSGSGDLIGENKIKTGDLDLAVSGSGNIDLRVDGEDMEMSISGSGDIEMEGSADEVSVSISGSGKLRGEDLVVDVFEASISGSGTCYITANKEIDARISGSGTVYYKGDPRTINSRSSGSGKVKRL